MNINENMRPLDDAQLDGVSGGYNPNATGICYFECPVCYKKHAFQMELYRVGAYRGVCLDVCDAVYILDNVRLPDPPHGKMTVQCMKDGKPCSVEDVEFYVNM